VLIKPKSAAMAKSTLRIWRVVMGGQDGADLMVTEFDWREWRIGRVELAGALAL